MILMKRGGEGLEGSGFVAQGWKLFGLFRIEDDYLLAADYIVIIGFLVAYSR